MLKSIVVVLMKGLGWLVNIDSEELTISLSVDVAIPQHIVSVGDDSPLGFS